jgi:hypothetical protein
MEEADLLADRIAIMAQGRWAPEILYCGGVSALLSL